MNYREAVKETETYLAESGIEDASVDAWYLLEYVICQKSGEKPGRTWYLMHREEEIPEEIYREYQIISEKRRQHIPLQHLTGEQEFFGFSFYVNEHVLIPRQDTEILVEEALKKVHSGMHILDMCTGSGCILLSILKSVPGLAGTGVDISAEALEVAEKNAGRLRAEADFLQSDLFEEVQGEFDMIVSNPPYIASEEIESLMPEVRSHEPRIALDGMEDGLYYYRRITQQSRTFLKAGGALLFEIGYDQGEAVRRMLLDAGFEKVRIVKDLAGLDRVVTGIKA